ncbi:MAG: hypothetical protein ICV64_10130 [Thermoleophilia bacterium]|nr:hypothetical protein [Thermoleophilia bacterium]
MRLPALAGLAGLAVATNALAAYVSISARMPAEWGKGFAGRLAVLGHRRRVGRDFATWKGTAMAAPLPMLVLVAGLAAAAARGSSAAARALGGLGAAGVVGHLGEPFTWQAFRGRASAAKTALLATSLAAYAGMAVAGLAKEVRS